MNNLPNHFGDSDLGHATPPGDVPGDPAARLGEIIHARRVERGLTLKAVAARAACTPGYLSQIERGRRQAPPSAALLDRLETILAIEPGSLAALADWHHTPRLVRETVEAMRGERVRTLAALRELLPRNVDDAWRTGELQRLVSRLTGDDRPTELRPAPRTEPVVVWRGGRARGGRGPVPLINAVAAGRPHDFTDKGYPAGMADEYVEDSGDYDPDSFAARITGESMMPEYREGDIVTFSPLRDVKSGMDCFVRLEPDSEVTFKRVYFEPADAADESAVTHLRLVPLNPAFATRVVPREQVAGLFAAVSVTRRLH